MKRTLLEKVQYMLFNAILGRELWAKVLSCSSHVINRLPVAASMGKTLLEVWSVILLLIVIICMFFYCPVIIMLGKGRLDFRAKKAIFLDFSTDVKGYIIW